MSILYLSPASISHLAQLILGVAITGYLLYLAWQARQRGQRDTQLELPIPFLAAITVFALLVLLNTSLRPGLQLYALALEMPAIAVCEFYLLRFAYHFPTPSPKQKWERRLVLTLALLYAAWEACYAVYRIALLPQGYVEFRPPPADRPLVAGFLWLPIVLARQTMRASAGGGGRSWWARLLKGLSALWRPQGRSAQAARAFTIIFLVPLGLAVTELIFANAKTMPEEVRNAILSFGLLLELFAFALAYLNYLPETSTFMAKLVGIALVTLLAVLGTVGWILSPIFFDAYPVDRLPASGQTFRFAPNARGGYDVAAIPYSFKTGPASRLTPVEDWAAHLPLAFPFPFFGQTWHEAYVGVGGVSFGGAYHPRHTRYYYGPLPAIMALQVVPDQDLLGEETLVAGSADEIAITWNQRLDRRIGGEAYTLQLVLYPDGVFDITHSAIPELTPHDLYWVGHTVWYVGATPGTPAAPPDILDSAANLPYSAGPNGVVWDAYLSLRHHLHRFLLPLAAMIVAGAAAIVTIFPLFFQRILIRPLNALLRGVHQVDSGNLEVEMPIYYHDEIGSLTKSFNGMVTELHALVTNLEERVAERTQQLRQQALDLAAAKAAAEEAQRVAETAAQAKSTFLANMSHELRTPLNAILGFSELMVPDANLTPAQRGNLEAITRSGEHLLAMINNVLDLSKIEAGRMTVQAADFDLHHLLLGLEEMFRLRAEGKGLALHVERAPDVPHYIHADQNKLRQVLINLLGNAVKFTLAGHVTLRAAPAGGPPDRLAFEVEDTGVGIAADDLDRIFGAFMQADSGYPAQEGTGLGLAISRQFVRLMGGEITVSSQVGQGSLFKFDIPVGIPGRILIALPGERPAAALAPGQPAYHPLALDAAPAGWLEAMRQATLRGNLQQVTALIGQIRDQDPALADHLAGLAGDFKLDEILDLIRPGDEGGHEGPPHPG
jgi:signal transduction histidine kinase